MAPQPRHPKLFGVLILIWALTALAQCHGAPQAALRYQRTLTAEARLQWGLDAPVPVLAAQINQESRWRERACSAFACGLAQFTPPTAKWISGVYPKELGRNDVYNPEWAIRAMVRYDHLLGGAILGTPVGSDCDLWAFTLSAYNGGLGWLDRDRLECRSAGRGVCDPSVWFGQVEHYTHRSDSARRENRRYPLLILAGQEPYRAWGQPIFCGSLDYGGSFRSFNLGGM